MRKSFGFKIQSQKNVIKLGNMIDDMWGIHLHTTSNGQAWLPKVEQT